MTDKCWVVMGAHSVPAQPYQEHKLIASWPVRICEDKKRAEWIVEYLNELLRDGEWAALAMTDDNSIVRRAHQAKGHRVHYYTSPAVMDQQPVTVAALAPTTGKRALEI